MANPPSAYTHPSSSMAPPSSPSLAGGNKDCTEVLQVAKDQKMTLVDQLVLSLCDPKLREKALVELSKKREMFQDLAPLLWQSFGTVATLLKCVASHPETRTPFLNAQLPYYIYPFLRTVDKSKPFEYLRLTSLGVIGALVKVEDTEVINFLLQSEVIPLCLQTMEIGSELSKTVATFIVQKVLLDDVGLRYFCATAERFFAMGHALAVTVVSLIDQPSVRLLKHIIRCYLRLSDNPRSCVALKTCLPSMLRDGTFDNCLRDEPSTQQCLKQLLATLAAGSADLGLEGTWPGV